MTGRRSTPPVVRPGVLPPAGPARAAPDATRTLPRTLAALATTLVCLVYIANPTLGLFELLPDNLPGIGNLDEAGAGAALLVALSYLVRGPRRVR